MYCLSYPRSGSSWFRYCFRLIIEGYTDKPELLCYSHWQTDKNYKIDNYYDIKNILLLRNYKECILSELSNVYITASSEPLIAIYDYIAQHDPMAARWWESFQREFVSGEGTLYGATIRATNLLLNFNAEQYVSDFLLPNLPGEEVRASRSLLTPRPTSLPSDIITTHLSSSFVHHFHFALQLKRYYELLEYHDKVSKTDPNNTLLIRYEDFMQNPFFELSNMIDFIEANNLVASEHIDKFRDNLCKLIDNIEYHKRNSIDLYKKGGHMALSYEKDNKL